MNGIFNPIVFYPAAVIMILCTFLTIKFKNIFYSLLSAIIVFFLVGFFFYVLGSEYNAVIQIAIYGVAVPIVLGLAIMFTDLKKDNQIQTKNTILKQVILFTSGIFILSLIYLIKTSFLINPVGFVIDENIGNTSIQVLNAFAQNIFVQYVWAFELISVILTIVIIGISLLDSKNKEEDV